MRHPQRSRLHPGLAGLTHRRITVLPAATNLHQTALNGARRQQLRSSQRSLNPLSAWANHRHLRHCSRKGGCSAHRYGHPAHPATAIRRYPAHPLHADQRTPTSQITRKQAQGTSNGSPPNLGIAVKGELKTSKTPPATQLGGSAQRELGNLLKRCAGHQLNPARRKQKQWAGDESETLLSMKLHRLR